MSRIPIDIEKMSPFFFSSEKKKYLQTIFLMEKAINALVMELKIELGSLDPDVSNGYRDSFSETADYLMEKGDEHLKTYILYLKLKDAYGSKNIKINYKSSQNFLYESKYLDKILGLRNNQKT
jgi:hypothetical protein